MKKISRIKKCLIIMPVIVSLLAVGCGSSSSGPRKVHITPGNTKVLETADEKTGNQEEKSEGAHISISNGDKSAGAENSDTQTAAVESYTDIPETITLTRPMILAGDGGLTKLTYEASVPSYQADDLSKLDNYERYKYRLENPEFAEKLRTNQFVVTKNTYPEYFEIYENNRYLQNASFVTVDSMMHTYHLYFAYLLKRTEKNFLSDELYNLSVRMMNASAEQYDALTDDAWKEAAERNMAFFAVGAKLEYPETVVPASVEAVVNDEISKIQSASSISECAINGGNIDYTQFIPRGYYEESEQLQRYFRAMMWYGQIGFYEKDDSLNMSAALMTAAMSGDILAAWEGIYAVTSFFAGASDDLSYYEYQPALENAFGTAEDVKAFENGDFGLFKAITDQMDPPAINSVPGSGEDKDGAKGFRFMGQRFSIDAAIFDALTNGAGKDASGNSRSLPDTLDVAAALGSDTAYELVLQTGAGNFSEYESNMAALRAELGDDETIWQASLYSNWLFTLKPLLKEKGEGYPSFMRSKSWQTKAIESFAGSFTELKHDTVLYAKQVMAEMGGGDAPVDDRGYVEPEAEVWARFINLSSKTMEGLDGYGFLQDSDRENLSRLTQMAEKLLAISEKELRNEILTDDEYEFIRSYGGNIEHFWIETIKEEAGTDHPISKNYPAALVTDIASNSAGQCLEIATANPTVIYVICPVAGGYRICSGVVYSFYQFTQPSSNRLTDSEWRVRIGAELNENNSYNQNNEEKPFWTTGYRVNE